MKTPQSFFIEDTEERENLEGGNTHLTQLCSAHSLLDTDMGVPHCIFLWFQLGKLKVQATASDSAERVTAWSQHYFL